MTFDEDTELVDHRALRAAIDRVLDKRGTTAEHITQGWMNLRRYVRVDLDGPPRGTLAQLQRRIRAVLWPRHDVDVRLELSEQREKRESQ